MLGRQGRVCVQPQQGSLQVQLSNIGNLQFRKSQIFHFLHTFRQEQNERTLHTPRKNVI